MARPDDKEDEKIAKPAARKECLVPEEEKHQQKANDQAQEWGVKESTVAKARVIPEIIEKRICIGQDGSGDCNRPVAARGTIRCKNDAQSGTCRSMRDDRCHCLAIHYAVARGERILTDNKEVEEGLNKDLIYFTTSP